MSRQRTGASSFARKKLIIPAAFWIFVVRSLAILPGVVEGTEKQIQRQSLNHVHN
ncbi:hypothetical protein QUA83_27605 [Microcoleus sp. K1-B1]|uniref:hypothetical protein n=1 Tax=Microcoleus sp. K1-B6 TaxID=2818787 RepID=UPI002FD845BE